MQTTLLSTLLLIGLALPINASDTSISGHLERLTDRIEALEKQVISLQAIIDVTPAKDLPKAEKNKPNTSGLELGAVDYELVTKEIGYREREFYKIDYQLKNTANSRIKLINATIQFEDLLGDKVFGIILQRDVSIAPDASEQYSAYFALSTGKNANRDARMKVMDKQDVVKKLVVTAVVYENGEVYE